MSSPWHDARVLAAALAAALGLAVPSACGSGLFVCAADDDCAGGGPGGVCEAQGWCSFADPACPTGRRFGELAGDGLAGDCVPTDDGTTGSGTTLSTTTTMSSTEPPTTSGGPTDPTIASLEGGVDASTEDSSGDDSDPNVCGDGVIGRGEECDFGNDNGNGAACRDDCQLNVCGDGYLGPGEQCDGDPGCTKDCAAAQCGNGVLEPGEACDVKDPMGETMSCTDVGYVEGNYWCIECMLDVSDCIGCGPKGCSYAPCQGEEECEGGEECIHLDNSFCSAACVTDEDCPGELPQVCIDIKGPPICLPTCEDGECPQGLDCYQAIEPGVCL